MNSLPKYKRVCLIGLQNSMEYRINYLTNLISVLFPILIQYFVWSAVYANKGPEETVFGYTFLQMIVYSLTAGFIARLTGSAMHYEVSGDIKNGTLSKFLVQPIRYSSYRIAYFIGEKVSESAIILCIMAAILVDLSPMLGLQFEVSSIALFLLDIIPVMLLNFLMFFCISLIAFWVIEVGHVYGVIDILIAIASGAILPLDTFGGHALGILKLLPFSYTTYFLTNILSGKLLLTDIARGMRVQFLWIGLLAALALFLWKKGLKKYVAVGG